MKTCLITQIFNEEHRIIDWIKYHKKMGFDRIIIFDDLSIDDTNFLVKSYIKNDNSVSIHPTSKKIKENIIFSSGNDYAGNMQIHKRILESYNFGLNMIKKEWGTKEFKKPNPSDKKYNIFNLNTSLNLIDECGKEIDILSLSSDKIIKIITPIDEKNKKYDDEYHLVAFLDVDEYIHLYEHENIKEMFQTVNLIDFDRFYLVSFDAEPPHPHKKYNNKTPVYNQTDKIWSENTRFYKSGWHSRTKMIVLANTCKKITSVHNGDIESASRINTDCPTILSGKFIISNNKNEYCDIFTAKNNKARLIHYRDLPQAEKNNTVYDDFFKIP